MTHTHKIIAATAFSLALFSPSAFAASWQISDNQDPEAPTYIFAEADKGALLLACNDGKMKAQISNDATDFAGRLRMTAKYSRGVDVDVTVGDASTSSTRWKLYPAVDTIYSNRHHQAARLYNGVVRGDQITVTVDGEAYTQFTPPAADETFKAFADSCHG